MKNHIHKKACVVSCLLYKIVAEWLQDIYFPALLTKIGVFHLLPEKYVFFSLGVCVCVRYFLWLRLHLDAHIPYY